MALRKILESDMQGKGNVGRNNPPGLSVSEMQRVLDELVREVTAPIFNEDMDKLMGTGGAAEIGTADGKTVQDHLNEAATDEKLKEHADNKENPHQVTKEQVGLGQADNTSDADKPVSTAQQEALDKKADKTTVDQQLAQKADKTALDSLAQTVGQKADQSAVTSALALKADKTELDEKADQTALDSLSQQLAQKADKTALDQKVDKISGKGLSSNDYTAADKGKVDIITTTGTGSKYLADDGTYKTVSGGGGGTGGTNDYNDLINRPQIGGVILQGDKTPGELGLQPAGNYATTGDLGILAQTVAQKADQSAVDLKADQSAVDSLSGAVGTLSGQVQGLSTEVGKKAAKAIPISASLTVEGWTGDAAPYTQTIAAAGVTADASQVIEVGTSEEASTDVYKMAAECMIKAKSKAEGTVTVEALEKKPTAAIPIWVVIYG